MSKTECDTTYDCIGSSWFIGPLGKSYGRVKSYDVDCRGIGGYCQWNSSCILKGYADIDPMRNLGE
jgi:hypothetical protein